jgi:Zn-dependent protease/Flp pilus assembly protein TadD
MPYFIAWIAIVFFSVLIHELGHAVVSLAFGYRPSIRLVWMGGLTQPNAPGPIPWHAETLLTLAGPGFGIALWLLALGAREIIRPSSPLSLEIFESLIAVNKTWSLLNLAPIQPLDGGHVSNALLTRAFGRRGFLAAQILGLVTSALLIGWIVLTRRDLFFAIFLAFFAVRAISNIAAYFRGEAGAQQIADGPLAGAAELYKAGRFEDAKRLAAAVLASDLPSPRVRSAAHHILGWIALKQGQGRAALDHFSQVQSQPVEPKALAAAFSLVGDEDRALHLWELAYQESKDPTLLHEWAGSLIRAGRLEQARKLAGVDMSLAYSCAERVLFIRGEFGRAAQVGLAGLGERPRAETAYDVACSLARAGDSAGALRLLRQAEDLGFRNRTLAASDADLAPLHTLPEFQEWLSKLGKSERQ